MILLKRAARRDTGVALILVLAFVVLVCALILPYLARTSTDRQLAHGTFNESRADQLARSALDTLVGDLKQEIVNGSDATTVNNYTIYVPTNTSKMLPARSGNPSGSPDPVPNLVRRSWANDTGLSALIRSRASAVNSTTDVSLNGRSVTSARWNSHYLVPRADPSSTTIDSTPVATFTTPDWVLVTRAGPSAKTSIGTGNSALNNSTPLNSNYVVGRYAYAVYDEGGLLDANVVGFPYASPSPAPTPPVPPQAIYAPSPPYAQGNSPTYPAGYTAASYTAQKLGRKGTAAFADLSALPAGATTFFPATQINTLVGWRNYASTQAGSDFATGFTFDSAAATRYYSVALSNLATFLQTSGATWNNRTDQAFVSRQQLLAFRGSRQFSQNLLQYLGTFSRELNRATWSPSTPTGSTIDYAGQAENSTAINRDLATVRATASFTRDDGTTASVGEPLLKTRFPLRRLSWLTYNGPSALRTMPSASPALPVTDPNYDMWQLLYTYSVPQSYLLQGTAANIKASFGLVWDSRAYVASPRAGRQWVYTSPNSAHSGGTFGGTTGTAATVIKTLNTVQSEAREPDFFELLKAVILNGSVGLGSDNTANTFVVSDPKYYNTAGGLSADYHIMQIGANIVDSWDADNVPAFISFNGNEIVGIENLPYLSKLVFMPSFASGSGDFFDAWLVPSLWNPHQNAPGSGTVRVVLNGNGSYSATGTDKTGSTTTSTTAGPIAPLPATMDIDASGFGTAPSPPTATPTSYTTSVTQVTDPSLPYWGFHYPFTPSTPNATLVNKTNADSAYPDFGGVVGASSAELQIEIPGTSPAIFVPYQTWKIATTGHPLVSTSVKNNFGSSNKLQDPEFIALDPRTVRFGIWGSDANGQSGGGSTKKDYTAGAADSLDEQAPASRLEQITLYQPQGASFTVGNLAKLSLYSANTDGTTFYKDLDGVKRFADATTNDGTSKGNTIMYPLVPGLNDRSRILSGPFQSVAELGQVFRDQPWKTLNFTTQNSGDAGLLDAFTLQDVPMTAGRISLNTRQAPVIAAILSQATKSISGTGVIPTAAQVANVAADVVSIGSLVSKSDLVAQLATKSSFTGLGNKEARECVIRALSDACQTRTWTLMIDVIAQSGRYPPTAQSLADFVVEGEKRYWLHIAIDRFTGEVIDQQLEAVYE